MSPFDAALPLSQPLHSLPLSRCRGGPSPTPSSPLPGRAFSSVVAAAAASSAPSSSAPSSSSRLPGDPGARTAEAAAERQQMFNEIAPVYDMLNDALSLGLHRVWKRMAVRWSGASRGDRVLDLCCGSGDVARLLSRRVGSSGSVVGLDFAREMLLDAERRSSSERGGGTTTRRRKKKISALHDDEDDDGHGTDDGDEGDDGGDGGGGPRGPLLVSPATASRSEIRWVLGDATSLPSGLGGDGEPPLFDAATLAYGLRNVSDPLRALREARRVLRPGARIAVLDFNHSECRAVDALQAAALSGAVVPAARALGVGPQYEYLRPSISAYPTGAGLVEMAREAGFDGEVRFHEIALGLMGVLVAERGRRR